MKAKELFEIWGGKMFYIFVLKEHFLRLQHK